MIASLAAVAAIVLWGSIATLEFVARDGYGRIPSA